MPWPMLEQVAGTSLVFVFPELMRVHSLVIFIQRPPGVRVLWEADQHEASTDEVPRVLTVAHCCQSPLLSQCRSM